MPLVGGQGALGYPHYPGGLNFDDVCDTTLVCNDEGCDQMGSDGGRIRNREVFLLDEDGTPLGVVSSKRALLIAQEKDLHLLIVQPDAKPPVARLMEYERHKYELEKRARTVNRKHGVSDLKELSVRYLISEHDYQLKLRSVRAFLADGDRVKLTVILRGRESQHADLALALLSRFAEDLDELATWQDEPRLDGKDAVLILSPA